MEKRLTIEDLLKNSFATKTYRRGSEELDPYNSVEIKRVKSGINIYMGSKSVFAGERYRLCPHPASKNILYFVKHNKGLKFTTPNSKNSRPIMQTTNREVIDFLEDKVGIYYLHHDVSLNVPYINFDEKEQTDE